MNRQDIANVIAKVPLLGEFGIGMPRNPKRLEENAKLQEAREALLDSVEACNKVCDWLSSKSKIKTINKHHTSYGLKHLAEQEIGYVTNGVFIAAAIHSGFCYKLIPNNPNVSFGISQKSLKEAEKRYYS